MFHVTTNTFERIPWCTIKEIPEMIIDNLVMTRNIQKAKLFAFCILPDHLHIIINTGEKGLSSFMHSFKRNTMRDIRQLLPGNEMFPDTVAEVRNFRGSEEYYISGKPRNRGRYGSSAAIEGGLIETKARWQRSFYDERIRSLAQCSSTIGYVQGNAMKHGLTNDLLSWPWTSLRFPELLDPMEIWLN